MIPLNRLLVGCVLIVLLAPTLPGTVSATDHFGELNAFSVTTEGGKAYLEWQTPSIQITGSAVQGYRIYRSISSNWDGAELMAAPPSGQTNYTDGEAPFGEIFFYQLRAVVGDDTFTSHYEAVRIGKVLPAAPDQLRCLAGDGSAWLYWLFGPGQMGGTVSTSFDIYCGNSSANLTKMGVLASWRDESWNTQSYEYKLSGLQNGLEYWVGVAAVNAAGLDDGWPVQGHAESYPWNLTSSRPFVDTMDRCHLRYPGLRQTQRMAFPIILCGAARPGSMS